MIKLFNNYVIDSDSLNYTFGLMKKDKNGKDVFSSVSYHGTLKQALEGARKYIIRKNLSEGEFTLKEALRIVEAFNEEFEKLVDIDC